MYFNNEIGKYALLLSLLSSLFFFIAGVFCPFFHITKFWFWKEDISVYNSVLSLFQDKEYFLGSVVLVFSISFPVIKYLFLLYIIVLEKISNKIIIFSKFSKYSMTEVFSIAIFLVVIKSSGLDYINIKILCGAYFFVGSAITSLIITGLIEKSIKTYNT